VIFEFYQLKTVKFGRCYRTVMLPKNKMFWTYL